MGIIAIETTGPYCSAALVDKEGRIHEKVGKERFQHLKTLAPMIEELLKECKMQLDDISGIGVSVGPGSFTGIRIGVTTGRALGQMTGIPLIPVPTLYAFGTAQREECLVCPIFDARRNQVYGGAYLGKEEVVSGGPYMLEEFLEKVKLWEEILFIGDGVMAYRGQIEEVLKEKTLYFEERMQSGLGVAKYALEHEGEGVKDYEELKPNYMRIPEAERRLKEAKGK